MLSHFDINRKGMVSFRQTFPSIDML